MSEDDQWSWHAYTYAFRRVFLGQFDRVSPVDEQGHWFNHGMVIQAERFYRQKHNRPEKPRPPQPSNQDAVRTGWRHISSWELTEAEHKIADPLVARLRDEYVRNVADVKHMPREKGDMREPKYRAPPPPPLADADDPGVREWMRRMGEDEFGP